MNRILRACLYAGWSPLFSFAQSCGCCTNSSYTREQNERQKLGWGVCWKIRKRTRYRGEEEEEQKMMTRKRGKVKESRRSDEHVHKSSKSIDAGLEVEIAIFTKEMHVSPVKNQCDSSVKVRPDVMIREEVTPRRRLSSEESRIPVPSSPILRRSGSVRLSSFSPIAEHARNGGTSKNSRTPPLNRHRSLSPCFLSHLFALHGLRDVAQQCLSTPASACLSSPDRDDDADSVQSFGSCSAASCASQCEHACFARNGTTYSGRQRRYVVHCSPHAEPGHEYLTPTQRANNTIRKLKVSRQSTKLISTLRM
ncbi:hypothetical protein LSTR_LSTR015581 [Laodelphax striatellus]|uniref:Uncharacterized protein n=1 Tax=Laodelphax striatellus TaxID=195883 RepID=A0A482WVM7_LAOST|nr:hypothetical protein LSTR_LSTR015581 [Laodelphax striatellus]